MFRSEAVWTFVKCTIYSAEYDRECYVCDCVQRYLLSLSIVIVIYILLSRMGERVVEGIQSLEKE